MKQKRVLLMMLVCLVGAVAYGDVIVNPSFESPAVTGWTGELVADDWAIDGIGYGIQVGGTDGAQFQVVGYGNNPVAPTVLFQNTEHIVQLGDHYEATFDAKFDYNDDWPAGFTGKLYYDDGVDRLELATGGAQFADDTTKWGPGGSHEWTQYTITYTVAAGDPAIGMPLGFSYEPYSETPAAWSVYSGVDNVGLTITNSLKAGDPIPDNGEDLVSVGINFEWSAPTDYTPTSYKMFLRKDNPTDPNLLEGVTVTSPYDYPIDLEAGVTYLWRIDSIEAAATTHEGTTWSFTTLPAEPYIQSQPVSMTVAASGTAAFTVEATNAGTYTWKKDAGTVVQTDGPGASSTLTITNVQLAEEGFYYCEVTNVESPTVVSTNTVRLLTERLLAQWTFENTLTEGLESIAGVYTDPDPNAAHPAETYSADSVQGDWSFSFDDDPFFVLVDNAELFDLSGGFTISAWVKVTQTPDGVDTYIVKEGAYGFEALSSSAVAIQGGPASAVVLDDGEWHQTVATCTDGYVKHYVDGLLSAQFERIPAPEFASDAPVIFGALDIAGTDRYNGLLDDVKMYTYEVDPYVIAHWYTDVMTTETICVTVAGITYDFNGDCRVNLEDFAMFASQWLNCNSVPDCK